jgi:hypothetical protein
MPTVTLLAIRNKIKADCDLNEETFISNTEINNSINDSIRDVEAVIHDLNEDYFFTSASLALVSGTHSYDLPTDVFANKIRLIQYNNGADKYDIPRIRKLSDIPFIDNGANYSYLLVNPSTGLKIKLFPTSRETSASNVTVYYIRNAKELATDADVCDVPEFINYVYWKVKLAVYQKEGNPLIVEAQKQVDSVKAEMIKTLSQRVPDDDNKVLIDNDIYLDME